ncbi:mannitol dehydrogenase family protein [Ideonella sp. A 288]|uniref:mannitol dehydrogenase family protein n=1 Tax=Ideonella sp. A 288 TaxID=1962181 RepID=UPI000B4B9514|nr:mannitol dehydrogenase family protein [Ideonella sp. A 288]
MSRLDPAALAALPADVQRPAYDRDALAPGIVHLGLGAFARAHLAVATEAARHADGDMRWGLVGVSMREAAVRDALAPQQGLYTVATRDADDAGRPRQRLRVIGGVREVLVAPEDPTAVLRAIARPATRLVSLTITEKGYAHDPATGALRLDHPAIAHDLAHAEAPRSAIGFVVHGLALRRAQGQGPITLLSLDNLPANGRTLQGLVQDFAGRVDAGLARWIEQGCTFPSSMVDRIVPRTTEADRAAVAAALGCDDAWPVVAEPFFDWAVEDRFAAGRPAWELGGARAVERAEPWEHLKLRMVNGSHSAIAYLGLLAGWRTVDEAIGQAPLRRFVDDLLRHEVAPTLPPLPGLDLAAYRASLLARFANPALAHRTQQIAMDGSQKLPQRLLGTVRDRIAAGQPIDRLALALAAWLQHLSGCDDAGREFTVDDPLAAALADLVAKADAQATAHARADALTRFAPVFGDLAGHPALVAALAPALESLRGRGARATLEAMT